MKDFVVIVDDCGEVAVKGGPLSIRTRPTDYGQKNFVLGYDKLAAGLSRTLSDRELDWIETAGNIFAVDLACEREGGDLGWKRSIDAHLPVRDPSYWNATAKRLEHIISDFTADRINLTFWPADDPPPAPRQQTQPFAGHDCVALLSGGVDSFVGGARLFDEGRAPLFVSHTAAGAISHAQSEVHEVMQTKWPATDRATLTAQKRGQFPGPEPSQRSRSFFFLAAAALAAAVDGTNQVYINENGVMALHLPLTAARVGSFSTHTASPEILDRVQALACDVLESPVTISNNLVAMTKPEVVAAGVGYGLGPDLQRSVSCWAIGRTSEHCGVCVPCLIRRISFEYHTVDDSPYTADLFEDPAAMENPTAADNITHLIRHIDDLATTSDLDLQINFPELLNGTAALPVDAAIEMQRRWAAEANHVLQTHPVPRSIR